MGACFSSDQKYHVRKVVYPVTKEDVKEAQDAWAAAIVEISRSTQTRKTTLDLRSPRPSNSTATAMVRCFQAH